MGKSRKTRNLQRELMSWIHASRGFTLVALLALALSAASAAQSDARLPQSQSAPSTTAAAAFTVAPHLPDLQPAPHQSPDPVLQVASWFRGIASWYGPYFNGRLTANGEVYDMYAMTAATSEFRTTLPLGTKVRVVDSQNGRSIVVRITDRGPLPHGRIIDLSYGAARKLAMVKPGTAQVRVHVLHWGENRYSRSPQ
jgi:rare lipoprotein A (peptidoglycan hydrolase)